MASTIAGPWLIIPLLSDGVQTFVINYLINCHYVSDLGQV
jgi:hypothetical protein